MNKNLLVFKTLSQEIQKLNKENKLEAREGTSPETSNGQTNDSRDEGQELTPNRLPMSMPK